MKVSISEIGKIQEEDLINSSGSVLYNKFGRVCSVIKPENSFDDRGDKSPIRMAHLFGGKWKDYNEHYIIQSSGCPLKCWYCYVDNLKKDRNMNSDEVVSDFFNIWRQAQKCGLPEINVLHFMGGDPGQHPQFWREIRESMNFYKQEKFDKKILFSDVVFVENYFYNARPWDYLYLDNFLLTGCLKGTNRKNFLENTGKDLFEIALKELEKYVKYNNFYLSVINYDPKDLDRIFSIIPRERIDFLKVIDYSVTKKRREKKKNGTIF